MATTTCDLVGGFTLGCRDNTGGVKAIYILGTGSAADGAQSFPTAISGSNNVGINGLSAVTSGSTLLTTISGSGTWYKFELFRQTSDFTEAVAVTPENGTVVYNGTLNAQFFKMQSSVQSQIKTLAQNPNLKIIVETNNGTDGSGAKWFLMGAVNGAQLLTTAGTTGKAFGDLNGYTLTFSSVEPIPAYEVNGNATSFSNVLQVKAAGAGMNINTGPF